MADSDSIDITSTPTDIVAGENLAEGDYIIQNIGGSLIYIAERDANVADVSTLVPNGVLALGEKVGMTIEATTRFYFWTSSRESKLGIFVT